MATARVRTPFNGSLSDNGAFGPSGASSGPSRAPSPTYTTFSGISNYRTAPSRDRNAPPLPVVDSRQIARTHWDELRIYLKEYLAKETANSRSAARQKLTRLTKQQFQELSTDVYDELLRRKTNEKTRSGAVPFLPVRDDFHPKRNQARQKLATLPSNRFQDLSSDVYYELARRYPEFNETPMPPSPSSEYDDSTSPGLPASPAVVPDRRKRSIDSNYPSARRPSLDSSRFRGVNQQDPQSGSGPEPSRRPSEEQGAAPRGNDKSNEPYASRRSQPQSQELYGDSDDGYQLPRETTTRRMPSREQNAPFQRTPDDRRRPSQDTTRSTGSTGRRKPSQDTGNASRDLLYGGAGGDNVGQSATSGMIIPNKSTIAEEEIQVPYGREARESLATERSPSPPGDTSNLASAATRSRNGAPSSDGGLSPDTPQIGLGDLGSFSEFGGLNGLTARLANDSDTEEGDYPRAPEKPNMDISRSLMTGDLAARATRAPETEDGIAGLNRRRSDSPEVFERAAKDGEARVRQLGEELVLVRQRADEQAETMRALQKELDELRRQRDQERSEAEQRARQDEAEIRALREQHNLMERATSASGDATFVQQLQQDMQALLGELSELSHQNDELATIKDKQMESLSSLDGQLKEYKRKYEAAKTELRSIKATSQLFLQAPSAPADHLPVSPDGGIVDVHVTAFLSAIDSLITAGRESSPVRVLRPMRAVVEAVAAILDDLRDFEDHLTRDRAEVDEEMILGLRGRAEATLSNLVAASKTHAQSAGLSPVSLLDAAASHVSAVITDISKTVQLRAATAAEKEHFASAVANVANGLTGSLSPDTPLDQPRMTASGLADNDRARPAEDAWAELKPYLETKNEAIVYAIQSVLSGVRNSAPPPSLGENIAQIIAIVSSIVAVCKDNLPLSVSDTGVTLLTELSDQANKLSELQSLPTSTKDSRQIIAKSSFAIANAMKGLLRL